MASIKELAVKVSARLNDFSTKMQKMERDFKRVGGRMKRIGRDLSIGVTAPIIALGAKSVMAFDKQAKAIAQVEAGLKSTGGTVGRTLEELQKQAEKFQQNTIFGDEEILQGVTAQLLTFTNITETAFDRTQQASIDLATRLGGDLTAASIMLGKALNDPVANLGALGRAGIQFSDSQTDMVKGLAQSGQLAQAQSIILTELEKQYGGSAAAATAGAGALQQLSNSVGDLMEDFGPFILEILQPAIDYIRDLVARFKELDPSVKRTITVVAALAAAVGPLLVALGGIVSIAPAVASGLALMTGPIGAIAAAAALTAAAIVTHWDEVVEFFETRLGPTIKRVESLFNKFNGNVISSTNTMGDTLTRIWDNTLGLIWDTIKRVITPIIELIDGFISTIVEIINAFKDVSTRGWDAVWDAAYNIFAIWINKLINLAFGFVDAILGPLGRVAGFFKSDWGEAIEEARKSTEAFRKEIQLTMRGAEQGVSSAAGQTSGLTTGMMDVLSGGGKLKQTKSENRSLPMAPTMPSSPTSQSAPVDNRQNALGGISKVGSMEGDTGGGPLDQLIGKVVLLKEKTDELTETQERNAEAQISWSDSFASSMGSAVTSVIDGTQSIGNAIKKLVGNYINQAISAIMAGTIGKLSFLGPAALPIAGAAAAGLKALFSRMLTPMATGGIATGPTPALVGEAGREAIIPLKEFPGIMNKMSGGAGGMKTIRIIGHFSASGNDLVTAFDRQINLNKRSGGITQIAV